MEGVTHPAFRQLLSEQGGLGLVCTEFVRVGHNHLPTDRLAREVVKVPGLGLSVQVMGNDPEAMAEAAFQVSAAGADVVDINLGCPMPRIVRKGVGAAMLKDLNLLNRVLCAMRRRVPGTLSAKMRAGFDDTGQAVVIAKLIEDAGADFLVVHPRRRADLYNGVADWGIVAAIKDAVEIPVVGNGDVWYAADALRLQRATGCDAVMIGRPAMRNPWIFAQVAALRAGRDPVRPSGAELVAFLEGACRRFSAVFSERSLPGKLKELLRFVARAVPDDGAFRAAVLREPTTDAIMARVRTTLGQRRAEELDLDAHGHLRLERSASAATWA